MLIFDNLGVMATEVKENEMPIVAMMSKKIMKDVLYNSNIIFKDQHLYTQLYKISIDIIVVTISLTEKVIQSNNLTKRYVWKLHSIEFVSEEQAHDIILGSLLQNKQIIDNLYKEVDSYVRRYIH